MTSAMKCIARVCLPGLAVFAVVACAGDGSGDGATVRDSAGIAIVENREAVRSEGMTWDLVEPPILEIGALDGAEEYQFTRIEGAVLLPGGRIAVADGGSSQIRVFDDGGELVRATGRRGDAPGEYRQITDLGYGPGDSLWVYDFGGRRFTVIPLDGSSVRTLNLGPELSNVGAVGRLANGSFVVREYWSSRSHAGELRTGLSRDATAVVRYSADGARLDTLGLFPGREIHLGSEDGRTVMSTPLFAHGTSAAVADSLVYIGDQQDYEVGVYSGEGRLRRLIRLLDVDLDIDDVSVEREIELRLGSEPPARRPMLRRYLEGMDVPDTRPAYGDILVDDKGNLWVGHAPFPHDPTSWRLFDAGGRLLGSVEVPDRFRIEDVRADRVLGVWRDSLDVERLRLFRLARRPAGAAAAPQRGSTTPSLY